MNTRKREEELALSSTPEMGRDRMGKNNGNLAQHSGPEESKSKTCKLILRLSTERGGRTPTINGSIGNAEVKPRRKREREIEETDLFRE